MGERLPDLDLENEYVNARCAGRQTKKCIEQACPKAVSRWHKGGFKGAAATWPRGATSSGRLLLAVSLERSCRTRRATCASPLRAPGMRHLQAASRSAYAPRTPRSPSPSTLDERVDCAGRAPAYREWKAHMSSESTVSPRSYSGALQAASLRTRGEQQYLRLQIAGKLAGIS